MPCTADLERRDYLDFLPKRPQGTTKILGASAFAGTKTPAALKFPSKGATTDCVETPVNCPHCGQKRPGRASVPTPAVYPAFFFVLEKAAKSAGNAVIPTFPAHCPHGLQHLRYKRPTFAFTSESGYTLGFRRRIAHNGSQGETRGVSDGGWYHYPRSVPHVRKPPRAGYQNGVLCRFWVLAGCALEERRKPSGQRCAYACRCPEASRPRRAA